MTIEEATALAEKLTVEIAEKESAHKKLREEEEAIQLRINALCQERHELSCEGRALQAERNIIKRVASGGCQQGLRLQSHSGKWDSHDCKNKAKPNEELCGIHLAVKKRDEDRRKRYA